MAFSNIKIDQVVHELRKLPNVRGPIVITSDSEDLNFDTLFDVEPKKSSIRNVSPNEQRSLVVFKDGRTSIGRHVKGEEVYRTPMADPGIIRKGCLEPLDLARECIKEPTKISDFLFRPAEGFESEGTYEKRFPGVKEMIQLKKEGRLLDILRFCHEGGYGNLPYVCLRLAAELNDHDGGLNGEVYRKDILFLGYLAVRNGGIGQFLSQGFSAELYSEMTKSGVLVDAIEKALWNSPPDASQLQSALSEARKVESILSPETQQKFKTRRYLGLLKQSASYSGDKAYSVDQLHTLIGRFDRYGEGLSGIDRPAMLDFAAQIIRRGYFYSLTSGDLGKACLDALHREGRLEPIVTEVAAKISAPGDQSAAQQLHSQLSHYLGKSNEAESTLSMNAHWRRLRAFQKVFAACTTDESKQKDEIKFKVADGIATLSRVGANQDFVFGVISPNGEMRHYSFENRRGTAEDLSSAGLLKQTTKNGPYSSDGALDVNTVDDYLTHLNLENKIE